MGNQSTKPHSIYRSSKMSLYEIIFLPETAYECINMLGNEGLVQFEDMNEGHTAFQRRFVSQIRRCDEIERQLRYIETEIKKAGIKPIDITHMPETPRQKEIGVIELILQKTTSDLKEENESIDRMKNTLNETKEMKYVLQDVQNFFDDGDPEFAYEDYILEVEKRPDFLAEKGFVLPKETEEEGAKGHSTTIKFLESSMKVYFIAGVINCSKIPGCQRMLWRISRGNIYIRFYDIEEKLIDAFSGDLVSKSVFIVFFLGEELKPRVTKICEGFRGRIYPCPHSFDERRLLTLHAFIDIKDLEATIAKAIVERNRILRDIAERDLEWAIKVRKMKSIYHTMNLLSYEATKTSLVGRCWIPTVEVPVVQEALREGVQRSGSTVAVLMNKLQTTADPPTYNKTNKFTRGFQVLVDAYGVASYQEFNPAPYYMITFPFLFGVMFGDMGHGMIILIFGLILILREKTFMKTREGNEIWKIFFGGRYIIFMMGIFAIYCGFIYNDVFSKSFNIFGSKWSARSATDVDSGKTLTRNTEAMELFMLSPFKGSYAYAKEPYVYGLDPVWSMSPLKIPFLNSFKMKTSIILGFVQMFGGLLLSLGNFIYFKQQLNIWCEFVPQILFLTCMFGYMVFLIFYKWIVFGPYDDFSPDKSNLCAPLILIRFIDMLMMQTSMPVAGCATEMFPHQEIVQRVLLAVIIICVPWMLLAKPLVIICTKKKPHQLTPQYGELSRENEATEDYSTKPSTSIEYFKLEMIASGEDGSDENESKELEGEEQGEPHQDPAPEEAILILPHEELSRENEATEDYSTKPSTSIENDNVETIASGEDGSDENESKELEGEEQGEPHQDPAPEEAILILPHEELSRENEATEDYSTKPSTSIENDNVETIASGEDGSDENESKELEGEEQGEPHQDPAPEEAILILPHEELSRENEATEDYSTKPSTSIENDNVEMIASGENGSDENGSKELEGEEQGEPHQDPASEEAMLILSNEKMKRRENEATKDYSTKPSTSIKNDNVEMIASGEDGSDENGSKELLGKEHLELHQGPASEEAMLIIPYEEEKEGEGTGEMLIHQGIHTIEFVLGSISHTASYLRLWALSLAHQQLSDVLYIMILETPMAMDKLNGFILTLTTDSNYWLALILFGLIMFCLFAIWSTLTLAILVVMEGLSAFLHTLRLHWVEFQSKFYMGLGHRFFPFSFYVIVEVLKSERLT